MHGQIFRNCFTDSKASWTDCRINSEFSTYDEESLQGSTDGDGFIEKALTTMELDFNQVIFFISQFVIVDDKRQYKLTC